MGSLNIPAMGMSNASSALDAAATRLARTTTNLADPSGGGDVVDLSAEILAMLSAKTAFQANVAAAKTMDEVQQRTISLMG